MYDSAVREKFFLIHPSVQPEYTVLPTVQESLGCGWVRLIIYEFTYEFPVSRVAAALRIVPTLYKPRACPSIHCMVHGCMHMGGIARRAFPTLLMLRRRTDGRAPVLVLDDAQSFSLPLAAVVYFCVEEPLPEKAPGPAAQGVMQNRSSASATLVEESTTDAAVAGVEALVLDGATPISKAPFRGRRPLAELTRADARSWACSMVCARPTYARAAPRRRWNG
eukprot:COSAG02_NODE_6174_length_3749_cov_37.310326_5_plen_222_part_00